MRKTTAIMTALGIGLTVAVLVAILALVGSLQTAFEATGDPLNLLVVRKGSSSELVSGLSRAQYRDLKVLPGIARGADGQPLASLEIVTIVNLERPGSPDGVNFTLRGLEPVGILMRRNVKLTEGRWMESGKREVVVGASVAKRAPGAALGHTIRFGRGEWLVVGVMDAGRGTGDSEIFADLNQVSADYNRTEALSSALVHATDAAAFKTLMGRIDDDRNLNCDAFAEKEYYASQTRSGAPIKAIGLMVAFIMAVGSGFAAMNTMYAAVARRAREIGTLRVLGFSRGSILLSFLLESLLLSALGGLVGCLIVLPLNGMSAAIGNFVTYSEITFDFHITLDTVFRGMRFALIIGALGGLLPAWMASRKQILDALREA